MSDELRELIDVLTGPPGFAADLERLISKDADRQTVAALESVLDNIPGDNYAPTGDQREVEATNEERERCRRLIYTAISIVESRLALKEATNDKPAE